jgi:hypothetical protein
MILSRDKEKSDESPEHRLLCEELEEEFDAVSAQKHTLKTIRDSED